MDFNVEKWIVIKQKEKLRTTEREMNLPVQDQSQRFLVGHPRLVFADRYSVKTS